MKTNYSPFKIGTVFNPISKKIKNNFPIFKSIEILFPSRLNAMAVDPSKIAQNKNMIYAAGEIVFSIPIFNKIKVETIDSADCIISETSGRKSLIKHAFYIMKKALRFERGLYIAVDNLKEIKHQGMGSSSGLLAGVCSAINEIYGCPLSAAELLKYVAQNHGEEIDNNTSMLIPVQCIGGSAASGLYEAGVLLLLGENLVAKTMDVPEDYSVILGFPKDFKEVDSKEALKKELENMDNFTLCGKEYGGPNAYNVLHRFIPAMIESNLEIMGDVIYDYRFNMGSIKNCSFLYPGLVEICNNISVLKKDGTADVLSISSVGPLVFAISKDPQRCQEIFEKEGLRTEITSIYNKKYEVIKSLKSEDVFWDNQSSFFSNKAPCEHIKNVLKNMDKKNTLCLLDVGCGGGRNLLPAIKDGFNVYGIDYSEPMLKETRQKLKGYMSVKKIRERIFKKNILELWNIKRKFDVIIVSGVIHQAKSRKELKKIIGSLSQLLNNGGTLVGNIFTADYLDSDMNRIDKDVYITKEGLHMTLILEKEFLQICEKNKFYPKNISKQEIKNVGTGDRSILRFEMKKIK